MMHWKDYQETHGRDVIIQIPAGTYTGRHWDYDKAEYVTTYTTAHAQIQISLDTNDVIALAAKALRSKGRRARSGPIAIKVIR